MLEKSTGWPVLVYALLLMILGFLGYQRTGSEISLYVGIITGVGVLVGSIGMLSGKVWGAYLALILTLLLTITFAFRYTATGKVFPALLSVLSGGMLLFLLGHFAKEQPK
jgi:uncharacterized membrane protein (UPF0136 family)